MSNRRKPLSTRASRNDRHLPFLTVKEADRLRRMMVDALAERGLSVTDHGDHLSVPDGPTFGLWNVAALCHGSGRSEEAWRAVVATHVERLMYGYVGGDPFEGMTPEDLRPRVYTRLWAENALPDYDAPTRPFAPGLVETLCLDVPGGTALINAERVERFGGWEALHPLGRANLEARPFEAMELVRTPVGGHFWRLTGDLYTASRALLLPGLLPEIRDEVPQLHDIGMGWLLAVPNRNEICWHIVQDGAVLPTLGFLAEHSAEAFNDAAGQLTPHVYWWSGSEYRQVTYVDDRGRLRLGSDPDFDPLVFSLTDAA